MKVAEQDRCLRRGQNENEEHDEEKTEHIIRLMRPVRERKLQYTTND